MLDHPNNPRKIPFNFKIQSSLPQHQYLISFLSATLIKSALLAHTLQLKAFAFKQIQFKVLRVNRTLDAFSLQKRMKDCDDTIS